MFKRLDEATKYIMRARRFSKPETATDKTPLMLLASILARAKGEDDTKNIESLRASLANTFPPTNWDFTCLLAFVRDNISAADHALYAALAARMSNPDQPLDNIDALLRRRPKKPSLAKIRQSTTGRTRRKR